MKFRDIVTEARDMSVPTEYRIGLGQLQAFYGDKHNSNVMQKDFDETCEMIGKKLKIKDIKHFVKWCETKMSFKMPMGKPIKESEEVEELTEGSNKGKATKVAQELNKLDGVVSAATSKDGDYIVLKVKEDVDFRDWDKAGIGRILNKYDMIMHHAYNGLSGDTFELRFNLTYGEVMKYLGDLMYKNRDELTSAVELYLSQNLR